MIFTIARKEFRSLFSAPSTWLILGALQFIFAWFFLARLDAYLQIQTQLAHGRQRTGCNAVGCRAAIRHARAGVDDAGSAFYHAPAC
jgi:hypothetical protein